MAETPNERLRRARYQAGYATASSFWHKHQKTIGVAESTYRSLENKNRNISMEQARRFARLLGASVSWLWILEGERALNTPLAKFIGYIGAGEQVFPIDDSEAFEPIPAPPLLFEPQAATVRGDSMLPVYREGDILFFETRERVEDDVIGRDCMVQIVDGPRQIKRVLRGSKKNLFRLFSYADLTESADMRLEWAAPVAWVMRA